MPCSVAVLRLLWVILQCLVIVFPLAVFQHLTLIYPLVVLLLNDSGGPSLGVTLGYPHVDIDKQSLANLDLGESWNFELKGRVI
jgi:hypothetical protein